jgi:ComF family protein
MYIPGITDLYRLFYPNQCALCHETLVGGESAICLDCLYHIPRTRFWFDADNVVAQIFWGRVNVENACAYFYFARGSKYRKVLHLLKYGGNKDVGIVLGQQFGAELKHSRLYADIDYIVPVPLHPKRLKKRGYNQAEMIADGLGQSLGVPVSTDVLIRNRYTETQTKKTRAERVNNVSSAFMLTNSETFRGKHLLLVDDVVTTGATLEACAAEMLTAPDAKVSIVTLAYASS